MLPIAIVAATTAVFVWSAWNSLIPAPTVQATPVLVRAASQPAIVDATKPEHAPIQAAGWIEPAPFAIAATALVEGVVAEVLVVEGDHVLKDQPIARLIRADAELLVAKAEAEVLRRNAMLVALQANAERARRELATLTEPSRAVAVAAAKSDAARAALAGFAAEIAERNATLAEVEDDLRRKDAASASGSVSEAELVRLRLRLVALGTAVEALPAKRTALEAVVAEADAELTAKRSSLALLLNERAAAAIADAEVAAAEAEAMIARSSLAEAMLRRDRTEIRAPSAGVILARLVAPGSRVGGLGEDSRVALLYDPSSLQVRADVPNADIALVGIDDHATITLEVLPNTTLVGRVTRINGQADIQKNTVQVKIAIENPPDKLRPDMLCRVRIGGAGVGGTQSHASRQQLFAPQSLVRDDAVIVVGPLTGGIGIAERRGVRIGDATLDGWVEVIEGLNPGDLLVDPTDVRDGSRVRIALERGGTHAVH